MSELDDLLEATPAALPFAEHPLRQAILAEVHARPFVPIHGEWQILQYAFMVDQDQKHAERQALSMFTGEHSDEASEHYLHHAFEGYSLRWEQHSEFSTYAIEKPLKAALSDDWTISSSLFAEGKLSLPGELIAAVQLTVKTAASPLSEDLFEEFDAASLSVSEVIEGRATLVTDFRANEDGIVSFLLLDHGLSPLELGATVRRVLELETYKTLSLLGLYEARKQQVIVSRIESELVQITSQLRSSGSAKPQSLAQNEELLSDLSSLAADLEASAMESLFRFGATRAYSDIVRRRLETLGEASVSGYDMIGRFLNRRLAPAMQTCRAIEERQANLSRKLTRAVGLLRARVDVELERQNRDLLSSMDQRAKFQLRLQQTVEGLSIAAISYYVISLIGYALKGAKTLGSPIDPTVGMAASVPLVVGVLWYFLRKLKAAH
ncbi:Uncharacterized membrane-anchored protein [Pseudovibrio denitrificans]|uniref:Uncharacterized membrane-anchored protein n=1 Tax=Pseudovibrio denitrificans TaxID=258256 RepID=A0A1I6XTN3_9HYPH|nr:DUF3422 domain-containing protein [Pseudovibrio denitrificans]SFT41477.1 Uncharacterized membrane-anchored protein [Pseudovibrio denitrificans]